MGNKSPESPSNLCNVEIPTLTVRNYGANIHLTSDEDTIAKIRNIYCGNDGPFGLSFHDKCGNYLCVNNLNIPIRYCDTGCIDFRCYLQFINKKANMYVFICDQWISVNIKFVIKWMPYEIRLIASKIEGKKLHI